MVKARDELAHDTADSLRRMGVREGSRISLISSDDPMLIVVENTRIALSHNVAFHIKVEALH